MNNKEDFNKCIEKEFGYTDSCLEGGWMMPNGTMIDFSGKNDGGTPNERARDHREIGFCLPDNITREQTLDYMENELGAIRIDIRRSRKKPSMSFMTIQLNKEQETTKKQWKRLEECELLWNSEIYGDIYDKNGRVDYPIIYPENLKSLERLFGYIKAGLNKDEIKEAFEEE